MRSKPLVTHYRQQIKIDSTPLSVARCTICNAISWSGYLSAKLVLQATRISIVHREWSASDTPLPPDRVFCGRVHRGRKRLAALRFVYHCPWRTASQTKKHGVAVTFWGEGAARRVGEPHRVPLAFRAEFTV